MGKISLRAYNQEIEKLIDSGANDAAITQCKYILNLYPKCIVTYRNLAKALLNSQRYPEAEDIFSRVLAVYPDDFISHIGLSMIQESTGNLDAAIWHMELAYDIQPSNPALTEELRRLFGRRDGVQPPKIRLTRGALIRMYARGELYQQAITEIQSALREDPKRLDLELILAQMHFLSGSLVESADVCSHLLSQIPYCFEANYLLARILPKTSQAESARVNKERLAELDPYFGFVTSPDMSGEDIPENEILLDHYEENARVETLEDTDWSQSVNLTWGKEPKNPSPDWLPESESPNGSNTQENSTAEKDENYLDESEPKPASPPTGDKKTTGVDSPWSEETIPDWMRLAGWGPSSDSESNALDNLEAPSENITSQSDEAQPGDFPDWLDALAPAPAQSTAPAEDMNSLEEDLHTPFNAAFFQEDKNVPEKFNVEPTVPESNTPPSEWTSESVSENSMPEQGETGENMPTDSSNNDENEWLNQFRDESPDKGEENDLPDWLKDFESEKEEPIEENLDIPEWLKSLEPIETAGADQPGEGVLSSGLKDEIFSTSDEEEKGPAVKSTSYLFTKALSEDDIKSGKLETAYLTPDAHPLPSDWADTLENVPEPPAQPIKEAPAGLPAWVRNALKQTAPAEQQPASHEVPEPASVSGLRHAVESSIAAENLEPAPTVQPEVSESSAPTEVVAPPVPPVEEGAPASFEYGEEPIHDLPLASETDGATSEETNTELLDWLRGFNESDEHPQEGQPSTQEPLAEPETAPEPVSENPLERLETFAPLSEEAETSTTFSGLAVEENLPSAEPESQTEAVEEIIESQTIEASAPETSGFEVEETWKAETSAADEPEAQKRETLPESIEQPIPESMESWITEPVTPEMEEPAPPITQEPVAEAAVSFEPPVAEQEIPSMPVVPDPLQVAASALENGDVDLAINEYTMALQDESKLPDVIASLKSATENHQNENDLWQLLGDAYAHTNKFEDAFSAYDKAEEILLHLTH